MVLRAVEEALEEVCFTMRYRVWIMVMMSVTAVTPIFKDVLKVLGPDCKTVIFCRLRAFKCKSSSTIQSVSAGVAIYKWRIISISKKTFITRQLSERERLPCLWLLINAEPRWVPAVKQITAPRPHMPAHREQIINPKKKEKLYENDSEADMEMIVSLCVIFFFFGGG